MRGGAGLNWSQYATGECLHKHIPHPLPISEDTRSLISAQQKTRNMRKDYSTEDITMFEHNAGLLIKLKDIITALDHDDCVLNEELIDAPRQLQIVTVQ